MNQTSNGDDVLLQVEGLAYGGEAVAKVIAGPPAQIGKKALIAFAVPGELVSARIDEDGQRLIRASLLEVKRAAEERCSPPCPYFTKCGGCDLQHMQIEKQRSAKLDMVSSTLRAKAGITPLQSAELLGEGLPAFRYRRRVHVHITPAGAIGFNRRGSGEVVDIDDCLLMSENLAAAFRELRAIAPRLGPSAASISLEESGEAVNLIVRLRERSAEENAADKVAELLSGHPGGVKVFRRGVLLFESEAPAQAGHFSQVNNVANEKLIGKVVELALDSPITELYAGAGNLSIPLALRGRKVTAVEVEPSLVRAGEENLSRLKLQSRIRFVEMSCERYLKANSVEPCVILDPPRAGAKNIIEQISAPHVRQIIYVSCNLPTLARDLAMLKDRGLTLRRLYVLDMFPQTHHVETISELVRN
ncbi:MAG: class I SAM-dependent RNA methyltransferase [Deltaproteobacteria bacterium]|nr:class I SAM-dependent RNA methyltransferase [Deltaproteobacteria bacterium]